jgi:hypothetical protein
MVRAVMILTRGRADRGRLWQRANSARPIAVRYRESDGAQIFNLLMSGYGP